MTTTAIRMQASVGPPIWNRLAVKSAITAPPTMIPTSPLSGLAPAAMATTSPSGSATTATVRPLDMSAPRSPSE